MVGEPTKETAAGGAGWKAVVVIALVAAVGAAVWAKHNKTGESAPPKAVPGDKLAAVEKKGTETKIVTDGATALPRLVDLGRGTCIPCKMMLPILAELKKEYAGKLQVEFIDIGEHPDAAEKYGIRLIPTQVFFDASGKEFFRHEGFFPKEDILKTFKDKEVDLSGKSAQAPPPPPPGGSCANGVCGVQETPPEKREISTKDADKPWPKHRFIFYFFHSEYRCPCSMSIEAGAAEAIDKYFSKELKSGILEWKDVNVEAEENAHFADDYVLSPVDHLHNGLVIVELNNSKRGRWFKLNRADELKDDPDFFIPYVKKEVTSFIKNKKKGYKPGEKPAETAQDDDAG